MSDLLVDPITLDLKLQRLQFETGLDVRAIIEERDEYRDALVRIKGDYIGGCPECFSVEVATEALA